MSRRRLILLCLLVIPAILFGVILLNPLSGNETSGLEIFTLIIGIPIVFLNAWEWQQPESLDNLITPEVFKTIPNDQRKTAVAGKILLILASGLILIFLAIDVFGSVRLASTSSPRGTSEISFSIGEIQTVAVMTAFANQEIKQGSASPVVLDLTRTGNPSGSAEPSLSETTEPGKSEPTLIEQSPLTPEVSSEPGIEPTFEIGTPISTQKPITTQKITNTPQKKPTLEPTEPELPDPVFLTGDGDDVVDFEKWKGPAILSATHDGDGNFVVTSYAANKQKIAVLVNTTGNYQGTLPLDFLAGERVTRFEVTATGLWDLQIFPVEQGRIESIPATIEGYGDDVVILSDAFPDQLKVDASDATQSFVIWAYSNGSRTQLINQSAPYTGILTCPPGITSLRISAVGPWLIDITTK